MGAACFDGGAGWGRRLLLRRAGLIDPAGGGDFVGDVLVVGGEIAAAQGVVEEVPYGCVVIDAAGLVGCPGFKETIATGARGGFAALRCRPNAEPPIDSESVNDGIEIGSALAHGGRMAVLYQLNAGEGA